jgi:hypothetical protein
VLRESVRRRPVKHKPPPPLPRHAKDADSKHDLEASGKREIRAKKQYSQQKTGGHDE